MKKNTVRKNGRGVKSSGRRHISVLLTEKVIEHIEALALEEDRSRAGMTARLVLKGLEIYE